MGISHYEIICDDILHWAETYTGPPFHSILCDPPYEIGFMNKSFDKTGVSFRPETWIAIGKHLLPGAFIMVFGGSRTHHRLACAIEDAGFTTHPTVVWLQSQGFPKATRIDTQVDRATGVERIDKISGGHKGMHSIGDPASEKHKILRDTLGPQVGIGQLSAGTPITSLAATWIGHRYGLQALKPAAEMIIVAQKPYGKRPVDSITETGAGALWIDGARIGTESIITHGGDKFRGDGIYNKYATCEEATHLGRWPANVILQHTPDCKLIGTRQVKSSQDVTRNESGYAMAYGRQQTGHSYGDEDGLEEVEEWQCAEGCPVCLLNVQSGEVGNQWKKNYGEQYAEEKRQYNGGTFAGGGYLGNSTYSDTGGASRFFFNVDWSYEIAEQIEQATPFVYQSKASRSERDAGLGEIPTGSTCEHNGRKGQNNSTVRPDGSIRKSIAVHNFHPTVKPLSLCKHLATLLLPPAAYAPRRILVPFCGSGSEMIACLLSGWEEVIGIELNQEYCDIAHARLSWWTSKMQETGSSDPSTILKRAKTTSKKQPNKPTIGNQSKESVVQPGLL